MKIIITYASCGTGHQSAAESLYDYFKENCQDFEIILIDALEKTNFLFKNLYTFGYRFLIHHAIWLWRFGFWLTYVKCLRQTNRFLTFVIHRLNTVKFSKFLLQENPDFIISTHFLPSEVSVRLKRTQKINPKIITAITDFGVHPFWVLPGTDLYVVASYFTKEQLVLQGVKEERVRIFGIPVEAKFFKKHNKDVLCEKLGIKKDKFTVLIITGSFGLGPIEEIIDLLYRDVQILAVCANNKKLYARLNNKNYPDVKVYGFVDNVEEFMSVSDIIITKPGGLSISEILAKELPPIFISPIPGQETQNMRILERYKVGLSPKHIKDIRDIILDYKEHPDELNRVKENIKAIKKPFATREICNAVCQGSLRDTC